MGFSFDLNSPSGSPSSLDDLFPGIEDEQLDSKKDEISFELGGAVTFIDKVKSDKNAVKIFTKAVLEKQVEKSGVNPLTEKNRFIAVKLFTDDTGETQIRGSSKDTSVIEELFSDAVEVSVYDIDDAGQEVSYILDPSRVKVSAMSDEEYQRFYDATYASFQNLALQYQSVQKQQESDDDREYPLTGRVEYTHDNGGKKSDKSESTDKKDQRRARVIREDVEKSAEKSAVEGKAAEKARYKKMIVKLEIKFQQIHIYDRDKKNAVNSSIQSQRTVKVILNGKNSVIN